MRTVLILFAHPRFEQSRVNRSLLSVLHHEHNVTVHDLYERYPDFNIDADHERHLLLSHDILVWQYPFYMYGAPALIKQWIDMVLEYGWAHGEGGCHVANKIVFHTLTTGGGKEGYSSNGFNRHTLREFLLPFEQIAFLCSMIYLPPFAVQGTYRLTDIDLQKSALFYKRLLQRLSREHCNLEDIRRYSLLNDWMMQSTQSDPI